MLIVCFESTPIVRMTPNLRHEPYTYSGVTFLIPLESFASRLLVGERSLRFTVHLFMVSSTKLQLRLKGVVLVIISAALGVRNFLMISTCPPCTILSLQTSSRIYHVLVIQQIPFYSLLLRYDDRRLPHIFPFEQGQ